MPPPPDARATSEPAVVAPPIEATNEVSPFGSPKRDAPTPTANESDAATTAAVDRDENPFDDAVYRSSTRDAELEVAGANPVVAESALARFASNKRNLAIAAGAVVLLVVVLVFALGGSDKPSSSKPASKSSAKKTETKVADPAKDEGAEPAGGDEAQPSGANTGTPTETPSEPAEPTTAEPTTAESTTAEPTTVETPTEKPGEKPIRPEPVKPKLSTIGGKPVVLDYDTQAREGKPVPGIPKEDQAAVAKARTSYAAGNQKLFAGDADSAIKNYRQALAYYPAYVAGYRGLGLAYAQKGDKGSAVRALRVYVSNAPRAKDAPLLRKRIETLSK